MNESRATVEGILESRHDTCRALLELSRSQASLIEADDYSELLAVLGRKQSLIERLAETKRSHEHVWTNWKSVRAELASDSRDRCDELVERTESLLAELVQLEETSTRSLVARREETRVELRRIDDGSRTNMAYRDSLAPSTHRHLDIDT